MIRLEFEKAEADLKETMPPERKIGFNQMMGGFYRRFLDLKNQLFMKNDCKNAHEGVELFGICETLLQQFEDDCGKIMEARVDLIGVFNAFWKAQISKTQTNSDKAKIFKPLDVVMDRRATLRETIKQMQLNSRVRYNQAVKKVDYESKRPGKRGSYCVTTRQVSISFFSRHVAFLEIIFLKHNPLMFWKKKDYPWFYHMSLPLMSYDQVTIHSVPETPKSRNFIEFRFDLDQKLPPLYFECDGQKQKKDILQQFRLLSMEACPSEPIETMVIPCEDIFELEMKRKFGEKFTTEIHEKRKSDQLSLTKALNAETGTTDSHHVPFMAIRT